jgi:hypothetical protein
VTFLICSTPQSFSLGGIVPDRAKHLIVRGFLASIPDPGPLERAIGRATYGVSKDSGVAGIVIDEK